MELGDILALLYRSISSLPSSQNLHHHNHHTINNNAALDRALGTAATVGLSFVCYRFISSSLRQVKERRKEEEEEGSMIPMLFVSLYDVLIRGLRLKRGGIEEDGGDEYFKVGKHQRMEEGEERDDDVLCQHSGSCHCGSIQFVLIATRSISAFDCPGKIRYPHHRTTARNFNLTCGTKYLAVYYVSLDHNNNNNEKEDEERMAAHAFCSRCGIHILRAPDSHSDALEVNVNCLDGDDDAEGSTRRKRKVNVSFYNDEDGTGLASGCAISHQWNKTSSVKPDSQEEDGDNLENSNVVGSTHEPLHQADSTTLPTSGWALNTEEVETHEQTPLASWSLFPHSSKSPFVPVALHDTPTTSVTTSCEMPRSVEESSASAASLEDDSPATIFADGTVNWAVASSSLAQQQQQPPQPPTMPTHTTKQQINSYSATHPPILPSSKVPTTTATTTTTTASVALDKTISGGNDSTSILMSTTTPVVTKNQVEVMKRHLKPSSSKSASLLSSTSSSFVE